MIPEHWTKLSGDTVQVGLVGFTCPTALEVKTKKNIKKALTCGALDTEAWDEKNAPMILPKIIAIAVLESEANQYKAEGTPFE